jgi:L-asparaginase II
MWKHPDMVAGPERFDTAFMAAGRGKWISKVGAEGFLAIGIGPGILGDASPGIGIAIKIADGDRKFTDGHTETRARPAVALEVLRQLGALDAREAAELAHFASPVITNWRQIEVGNLRPVFQLERKSA